MSPGYPFNIMSKGQRSRSQGHKVQEYIVGNRVVGVSLHSNFFRIGLLYSTVNRSDCFDVSAFTHVVNSP